MIIVISTSTSYLLQQHNRMHSLHFALVVQFPNFHPKLTFPDFNIDGFLNSPALANAVVRSDVPEGAYCFVTRRDIAAGEELLLCYGSFSNWTLALDYGFVYQRHFFLFGATLNLNCLTLSPSLFSSIPSLF
jgi:hypothetical protein